MPTRGELTVFSLRPPPRPGAAAAHLNPDWSVEEGGGARGNPPAWGRTSSPGSGQPRHPPGTLLAAVFVGSVRRELPRCSRISSPNPKPGFDASSQEERDFLHYAISFSRTASLYVLPILSHRWSLSRPQLISENNNDINRELGGLQKCIFRVISFDT